MRTHRQQDERRIQGEMSIRFRVFCFCRRMGFRWRTIRQRRESIYNLQRWSTIRWCAGHLRGDNVSYRFPAAPWGIPSKESRLPESLGKGSVGCDSQRVFHLFLRTITTAATAIIRIAAAIAAYINVSSFSSNSSGPTVMV